MRRQVKISLMIRTVFLMGFSIVIIISFSYVSAKLLQLTAEVEELKNIEPQEKTTLITVNTVDEDYRNFVEIEMICTAYCPCGKCSGRYGTNASTGRVATAGRTVAVDPAVIPYGTEIEIDGRIYIAEDCGGAIKGNKIDIYFDTHEEAEAFGKQKKMVRIYY